MDKPSSPDDAESNISKVIKNLRNIINGNIENYVDNESGESIINSQKIYKFGEKHSGYKVQGDVQDYYELKDYHCSKGTLFEDQQFDAIDSSLYYETKPKYNIKWLRPHEICKFPRFFVDGVSRFDINQGGLGDCWFLAAVATLTLRKELFFQVVPSDQSFDENYAGIFHFRFWQYGRWIDIVIDDRLPTYNGQLVYLHSSEKNEFWGALLEKAYAKLHGSYEILDGGFTCEALEDFTGGVTEMYFMNDAPKNLFEILSISFHRNCLMGSSINPDPNVVEAITSLGLVRGHAYSITKVQTVNAPQEVKLLRLRNPWGKSEWIGDWSDKSSKWQSISAEEKHSLGLTIDEDGEFWMSFDDFKKNFDRIEICHLNPVITSEELLPTIKNWDMSNYEGQWIRGFTAGGCKINKNTFASNPQFTFTLSETDDKVDGKCTLIVALMQKYRMQLRMQGLDKLPIGFAIYPLQHSKNQPKPLDRNFFQSTKTVEDTTFIPLREISQRCYLPPGTYCIVPSTYKSNENGQFLMRIFSEQKHSMEANDGYLTYENKKTDSLAYTEEDMKKIDKIFLSAAGMKSTIHWKELQKLLLFDNTVDLEESTKNDGNNKNTSLCISLCCCKSSVDEIAEEIEPLQLSNILNETAFSDETCMALVAFSNKDFKETLVHEEFIELWTDIQFGKKVFKKCDKNKTNSIDAFELRDMLNETGYNMSNRLLVSLVDCFGNGARELQFQQFIVFIVALKHMMVIFQESKLNGVIDTTLSVEDLINITLAS